MLRCQSEDPEMPRPIPVLPTITRTIESAEARLSAVEDLKVPDPSVGEAVAILSGRLKKLNPPKPEDDDADIPDEIRRQDGGEGRGPGDA